MGKITGFMEFARDENASESVLERIKDFNEFHTPLPREERREQAARCMNCGVPFCQSGMFLNGSVTGCPLHNLIPEWNDEVYNDNYSQALLRLLKTNSFPEFTGRVCPAPCESACVCGLNGASVTIKDNELDIIENAFAKGIVTPVQPKVRTDKKVAVIGSGPAGLACADRLNKRGHNVTVFEKNDRAGGLLMYGIPNMKLEKEIVQRRIDIMTEEGIKFEFNIDGAKNAKKILKDFDAVVLCCGAEKPRDIDAEKRKNTEGIYFAVDFLTGVTKSLLESKFWDKKYIDTKDKNVVIAGGGDTGNDCVGTAVRHGCKSVVQLEIMSEPPRKRLESNPWPEWAFVKRTDYGQEEATAVFGKDPRIYNTTVKEIIKDENNKIKAVKTVRVKLGKNRRITEIADSEQIIECDILIIAAGFVGCDVNIAKSYGVEVTERQNVKTSDNSFRTNVEKVFTAGDMHRGQSLVVWAIREGRDCAREVDEFLMGYSNMS